MNAIHIYRIANILYRMHIPLLPVLLRFLMFLLYNSAIPPQCSIGKRLLIGQGVTLGGSFGSGAPSIENDVWIGPGVRMLGEVTIGSNSIIGANTVVTQDVAENSEVGGVPAKLIRTIKPGPHDVLGGRIRDE